ncbi:translation protein SH3-like domain-containing protein [Hyaloraphidium curvatum]|nr:translation protein SH3-like domain-containing protein [Hyaloraphidium curvatum]
MANAGAAGGGDFGAAASDAAVNNANRPAAARPSLIAAMRAVSPRGALQTFFSLLRPAAEPPSARCAAMARPPPPGCRAYASATKGSAAIKKTDTKKKAAAPPAPPIPALPAPADTAPELVNMGLLRTLDLEHRIRYDPDGRSVLFARKHPARLRAGAFVAVETAASVTQPTRSIVVGYIVAIRRRGGMGSNFVVRTTVLGTGVEIMFPIYSPLVTKIELLQPSEGFRRGKLHYLKDAAPRSLLGDMFKKMDQRVEEMKKKVVLADRSKMQLVK